MTSSNKTKIEGQFPEAVLEAKVWGCWAYDSQGRKIPRGGFTSNSHDNSLSFKDACALADANGWSLAIQLGEMPSSNLSIVGCDFDKCFGSDGELKDWAEEGIERFDGFHFEVSPSGSGLKGIAVIENTEGVAICDSPSLDEEGGQIELHLPHSGASARYYTVTGDRFEHDFNGNGDSSLETFSKAIEWVNAESISKVDGKLARPAKRRKGNDGKWRKRIELSKTIHVPVEDILCSVTVPITREEAGHLKASEILAKLSLPAEGGRNNYIAEKALHYISETIGLIGSQRSFDLWDAHFRADANYTEEFGAELLTVFNNSLKIVNPTNWDLVEIDTCRASLWQYVGEENWTLSLHCEADGELGFAGETPEEAAQKLYDSLSEVEEQKDDDAPDWIKSALEYVNKVGLDKVARDQCGKSVLMGEAEMRETAVETEVIIKNLFAKTMYSCMAAPSKAGKTTLACDLYVSLCTGTDFLECKEFENMVGRPVKTLLISAETPQHDLAETIREIRESRGIFEPISNEIGPVWQTIHGHKDGHYLALLTAYIEKYRPEVVIFDPLYFFLDDEAIQKAAFRSQIERLMMTFTHYGITPIFVDHTNKGDSNRRKLYDGDIRPADESHLYGNGRDAFFRGWIMLQPRKVSPDYSTGVMELYLTSGGAWQGRKQQGGEWAIDVRTSYGRYEERRPESPYRLEMIQRYSDFERQKAEDDKSNKKIEGQRRDRVLLDTVVETITSTAIQQWKDNEEITGEITRQEATAYYKDAIVVNAEKAGVSTKNIKNPQSFAAHLSKAFKMYQQLESNVTEIKIDKKIGWRVSHRIYEKSIEQHFSSEVSRMIGNSVDYPDTVPDFTHEEFEMLESTKLNAGDVKELVELFNETAHSARVRSKAEQAGYKPEVLEALKYWKPF
ncbi:MAG: AAA family ATPase [Rubripirellula sp.]